MTNMVVNITEMNAAGSMTLEQLGKSNQTLWKTPSSEDPLELMQDRNITLLAAGDDNKVMLQPQQIKTFKLVYPGGAKKLSTDPQADFNTPARPDSPEGMRDPSTKTPALRAESEPSHHEENAAAAAKQDAEDKSKKTRWTSNRFWS